MIADGARMQAYTRALECAVRPGSSVADLGTGLGIFALIACRLGAARVYAIDPNPAIEIAIRIAECNGYADRIQFLQARSMDVSLPERVDVIVSDMRGILPLSGSNLAAIIDARERFLARGGTMVPLRDALRVAVVEAPDLYRRCADLWLEYPGGFDMAQARRFAVNTPINARLRPAQLPVEPRRWAVLDYSKLADPAVRGEAVWEWPRSARAHGLLVWFDSEVAEGIHLSNAPDRPELVYGSVYLPWSEAVAIEPGDEVRVSLAAHPIGESHVWRWNARVRSSDGRVKADLRQSTFEGVPIPSLALRRRAASYVPQLSPEGLVERFILEQMGEGLTIGEIACRAMARFPERFAASENALAHVGEIADRCSR